MNAGREWPPQPQAQQHRPGQHPPRPQGLNVLQPKHASPQLKKAPAAPPAYRPQPTPRVLQTKAAAPQAKTTPAAPPAHRPQHAPGGFDARALMNRQPPTPRPQPAQTALQTKTAEARPPRAELRHTHTGSCRHAPVAPQASRPGLKGATHTPVHARGAGQKFGAAAGDRPQTAGRAPQTPSRINTGQKISGPARQTDRGRPARGVILPKSAGRNTIQRQIYWNGGVNQFQIDNTRPAWMGAVGALAPGQNQSRNHIISFEVIQNDLANMLNALVGNFNATNQNKLINMTEALYDNNAPPLEVTHMRNVRTNLVQDIQNNTNNYTARAQALLQALNSSSSNVRLGDSGLNSSIGLNLDAEFNPGTTAYTGWTRGATDMKFVVLNNMQVLTLTPQHNNIVYNYQSHTGMGLSFVLNGIGGAVYQNVPQGQQLSSTQLPTVAPPNVHNPYRVLVTDPSGNGGLPFLYR